MIPLLEAAAPVLCVQHSLITRRQSLDLAHSESELRRLLRTGIWEAVDSALYGPTGVPLTWRRRLMAASLLAPDGSLISHRAAAALHGIGGLEDPTPEISIPRGSFFRRDWCITHESGDLELADRVSIDGIPTTGLRRLAMDLGGVISFPRYKHAIRTVRHGHGVTSPQLLHTYLRHKCQGRTGGAALRDWLDRYFTVDGVSESGAEFVVLDAILDAGLPTPVRQHPVAVDGHRYRLDLAYPEQRIVVEVDGSQHEDRDIAAGDERRSRRLRAAGWTIIRVRAKHLATDLPAALRAPRSHLHLA